MEDFRAGRVVLRLPVGTLALIGWLTGLLTAADSPNDRQPTDPKSPQFAVEFVGAGGAD